MPVYVSSPISGLPRQSSDITGNIAVAFGVVREHAMEVFRDDLRERSNDRLLRLRRGGTLDRDCRRCLVCRARSGGPRNRRTRPGARGLVDRRRHRDGYWHLGDAFQGDARIPFASVHRVPVADCPGVSLSGDPLVRSGTVFNQPPENGLG